MATLTLPHAGTSSTAGRNGPRTRRIAALIGNRIASAVFVLLLILLVVFLIGHFVGDPVLAYAPPDPTDEQLAQLRHSMGFDRSVWTQLAEFLKGVFTFDLGESIWQKRPAMDAVLEVLPNTLVLAAVGAVAAGVIGVLGGVLSGVRPGTWLDRVVNVLTVASLSVANFWVGLLLIIVFAVQLRIFPTSGWFTWQGIVLPAATIAIIHSGRICQITRAVALQEMSKPHVLVAQSRGLAFRRVVLSHVVRNASPTIATTVGWELARMLGGAIYPIELVFGWPGVGPLMMTASSRHDFPVVEAAVLVTAGFVIVVNLIVDVGNEFLLRTAAHE